MRLASSPKSTNAAALVRKTLRFDAARQCLSGESAFSASGSGHSAVRAVMHRIRPGLAVMICDQSAFCSAASLLQIQRRRKSPHRAQGSPWHIRTSRTPLSTSAASPGCFAAAQDKHSSPGQRKRRANGRIRTSSRMPTTPMHRRRINSLAQRLVIEADVAARDWDLELFAGLRDAVDRLRELPHDVRLLGISEVQAIRGRTGVAPVQATLRAASATACMAPSRDRDSTSARCHRAPWPVRAAGRDSDS
jgi:hypothetical protein